MEQSKQSQTQLENHNESHGNQVRPKTISKLGMNQTVLQHLYQLESIDLKNPEHCEAAITILQKQFKLVQDIQFIKKLFKSFDIFKDKQHLLEIAPEKYINQIQIETYKKNDILFRRGDQGSVYYIVLKGACHLLQPKKGEDKEDSDMKVQDIDQPLVETPDLLMEQKAQDLSVQEFAELKFPKEYIIFAFQPSQTFGEIALLTRKKRTGTIICDEDTVLLSLSREGFNIILGEYHEQIVEKKIAYFQQFSIMQNIPYSFMLSLLHNITEIPSNKHHIIYKEDEIPKHIYFIKEGEVQITKILEIPEEEKVVNQRKHTLFHMNTVSQQQTKAKHRKRIDVYIIGPNQYFGEYEIIKKLPTREMRAEVISHKADIIAVNKKRFLNILDYFHQIPKFLKEFKARNYIIEQREQIYIEQISKAELNKLKKNNKQIEQKQHSLLEVLSKTNNLENVMEKQNTVLKSPGFLAQLNSKTKANLINLYRESQDTGRSPALIYHDCKSKYEENDLDADVIEYPSEFQDMHSVRKGSQKKIFSEQQLMKSFTPKYKSSQNIEEFKKSRHMSSHDINQGDEIVQNKSRDELKTRNQNITSFSSSLITETKQYHYGHSAFSPEKQKGSTTASQQQQQANKANEEHVKNKKNVNEIQTTDNSKIRLCSIEEVTPLRDLRMNNSKQSNTNSHSNSERESMVKKIENSQKLLTLKSIEEVFDGKMPAAASAYSKQKKFSSMNDFSKQDISQSCIIENEPKNGNLYSKQFLDIYKGGGGRGGHRKMQSLNNSNQKVVSQSDINNKEVAELFYGQQNNLSKSQCHIHLPLENSSQLLNSFQPSYKSNKSQKDLHLPDISLALSLQRRNKSLIFHKGDPKLQNGLNDITSPQRYNCKPSAFDKEQNLKEKAQNYLHNIDTKKIEDQLKIKKNYLDFMKLKNNDNFQNLPIHNSIEKSVYIAVNANKIKKSIYNVGNQLPPIKNIQTYEVADLKGGKEINPGERIRMYLRSKNQK